MAPAAQGGKERWRPERVEIMATMERMTTQGRKRLVVGWSAPGGEEGEWVRGEGRRKREAGYVHIKADDGQDGEKKILLGGAGNVALPLVGGRPRDGVSGRERDGVGDAQRLVLRHPARGRGPVPVSGAPPDDGGYRADPAAARRYVSDEHGCRVQF